MILKIVEFFLILISVYIFRYVNNQPWGRTDIFYINRNDTILNQQTWFDPCSFTHFILGMLFQQISKFLVIPLPKGVFELIFVIFVCAFEIVENNKAVVGLWGDSSYGGDAVINSFTDIIIALFGYALASKMPSFVVIMILLTFVFLAPCGSPRYLVQNF
jgi:hypothetical protein